MSRIDRMKQKLEERIKELQDELTLSLTKKSSDSKEINLYLQQKRINELKDRIKAL